MILVDMGLLSEEYEELERAERLLRCLTEEIQDCKRDLYRSSEVFREENGHFSRILQELWEGQAVLRAMLRALEDAYRLYEDCERQLKEYAEEEGRVPLEQRFGPVDLNEIAGTLRELGI